MREPEATKEYKEELRERERESREVRTREPCLVETRGTVRERANYSFL